MDLILKNKNNTAISLVCLFIYLSVMPMHLSNYVLCIGTDGHIHFEIGLDGGRIDTHDFHHGYTDVVITAVPGQENHCGPCVDIAIFVPLNIDTYLVPVQSALASAPAFVGAFVRYLPSDVTSPTYALLQTSLVTDPTLISLRSTTLLI